MMTTNPLVESLKGKIRVKEGRCPAGHLLMTEDRKFDGERAIAVKIRCAGRTGMLYLNPFYGKFEFETEVPLKEGETLEVMCPECSVVLEVDEQCHLCNIPMFAIQLPDGGQVEACPKVGCHNHALKIVDLDAQLARMYVDETKVQM